MTQKKEAKQPSEEKVRMTDERRMRASGAAASGYHAPTEQDIQDIRKDHHTATTAHAVNADEFIRLGGSTEAPADAAHVANLHPRENSRGEEIANLDTVAEDEEVGTGDEYPAPVTPGDQMSTHAGHDVNQVKRRSA